MKRALLVLVCLVFVIMFSRTAFAYISFFDNAGYDEDLATMPNGFKSSPFPFYDMTRSHTNGYVAFAGVNRSGVTMFNHTASSSGLIVLRSESLPVNTTNPLVAGIEFAVSSVSGLNTSTTYLYIKEVGAYSYIGQTNVPDLTANHWYYVTAVMYNASAYNGKNIELGLSFPMWTTPANLTIYVNRVVLGSVDTEEFWNPEPNDTYLEAMCNDEYTTGFDSGNYYDSGSSMTYNLSGSMVYLKTFNLADSPKVPCATLYREGNSMLTVRPATGGFNQTYGWAWKWGTYENPYCGDGAWGFYMFTKDYFWIHHAGISCCFGSCGTWSGGYFINYLDENYTIGTSLGCDYGIGGSGIIYMGNTSITSNVLCNIYGTSFMGSGVVTGLNYSPTMRITSGDSYGDDRVWTNWIANPLNLSTAPVCTEGFRCTNGNEYHLSSSCSLSDSNSCGDCGCAGEGLGYRCLSGSVADHWICHSPSEAWHYNATCSNDVQLHCDVSCSDGQCVGENACASDSDCSDYCVGSTLHAGAFCNTTTYDCAWNSTLVCPYGCAPSLHACSSQPSAPPVFQNRTVLGVISEITTGILGFVSFTANPFLAILFIAVVAIIIIGVFSLFAYIAKHIGDI